MVVGKHGHSAVERNRLRRKLRELVRLYIIPEFTGIDIVLYASPGAYELEFKKLMEETIRIKARLTSVVQ